MPACAPGAPGGCRAAAASLLARQPACARGRAMFAQLAAEKQQELELNAALLSLGCHMLQHRVNGERLGALCGMGRAQDVWQGRTSAAIRTLACEHPSRLKQASGTGSPQQPCTLATLLQLCRAHTTPPPAHAAHLSAGPGCGSRFPAAAGSIKLLADSNKRIRHTAAGTIRQCSAPTLLPAVAAHRTCCKAFHAPPQLLRTWLSTPSARETPKSTV